MANGILAWICAALPDLLGFLGSLLLAAPALQASRNLKAANDLLAQAKGKPYEELGTFVAGRMADHADTWQPWHHNMLMAGLGLLALSFLLGGLALLP